jgi:hypothetical protein
MFMAMSNLAGIWGLLAQISPAAKCQMQQILQKATYVITNFFRVITNQMVGTNCAKLARLAALREAA